VNDYERALVTDRLYLNAIAESRDWKKGEIISEYGAVIEVIPQPDGRAKE